MKNAKRWLAVLLAVTLLGSNAVYQLGTTLSANEIETVAESQQDESENAVAVQSETQMEDTGEATVQEVTPQEDKSEASVQEAEPAQESQPAPAEQTQEAQVEAQKPVVVEVPPAEQIPDAAQTETAPADVAQAENTVAQTYSVKINKPDLDGGQIKVWGADENKVDVTSYDANNQYVKEVTEGEDFHFQITLNDGFTIEKVTDQNDNIINPENTDGNVTTYKLGGVNEEKVVEITYNIVETPEEEEPDSEVPTEADVQPNEEIAVQAAGSTRAVGQGITAYVVTSSDDTTYGVNSLKIRYEDTNGKDIKLNSGAIKTFTFGNTIYVNKATFAQPAGVIDGYVFEDAYFFWSGHYSGTKYSATEFYNFGSQVTHYDSNIGFKCTNTTQNTDKDGYFAYNPTGVLHLVYKKVTPDASYNIYYMNGSTQYDKLASTSAWKNGKYVYYFKATQKADPTYPNPQTGHTYTFKGWNTKADGSGEWVQNVYEDGKTEITSDIYLYAIYDDTADINEYVTLTPEDVEKLYNGQTYTSGTAKVSAKKDGADLSGIKIEYQKKDGTWTENPKDITAKDVTDSMTVNIRVTSDKYTGELTGTQKLTINPRKVTLTSGSDEKKYDGTALTKDGITVSGDGFVTGEEPTYNVTGTITNVGKEDNTFTYEFKKGTKESNYKITPKFGTLEITPCTTKITVTITENSGSKKYDGTEKTVTGYKVTDISNKLYTKNDFSFTGDEAHKTVSATNAGSYDMGLVSGDFTNNNKNFSNVEFKIVDGKLDIAQRKVTLTSGTDSKTYDGTPLTKNEVTVDGDGFVTGEEPAYDVTGTITEAGTVDNTFTYTFAEGVVKENYDIEKIEGTLTVAPIDKVVVTITGKKDSTTYNGKEQKVKDYDVSISNAKYTEKDFTFSGKAIAKGTDAGTYKMGLKASDFKNTNKNFENVEFNVVEDGELKINPRKVTLTSGNGEKVYDGNALTNKTVTESDEGFVGNDGATYKVTGSQTNAGESENTFTYKLKDGTNADNYTITTENGKLKVTPVTAEVTVTITENSDKDKYDGTEKTVTGYTVTSISNPAYTEKDFAFTGDEAHKTVSGTNAGTYDMNLEAGDFTNISGNFTNVKFEIKDGTLVIDKRTVTLTSATDEKPYDGQPLENHEVTVGGDGFAEGEGAASYNVTGTQTNVGESDNTFEGYTLNENTLADNYTITTAAGKLKVTPVTDKVTVTIRERSGNDTYDGTEKTVTGYDIVSISNPLYNESDFSFTGEEAHKTVSGTDAGTYNMALKPADFTNNSANFTNVEFVIEDGTLVIAKRKVTFTSATADKPYDGTPLTKNEVTVEGDGFAEGEGAVFNVTGSQTLVGESDNTYEYTLNSNTKEKNYEITKHVGTLTVTDRETKYDITVKANSKDTVYDGTEQTVIGFEQTTFVVGGNTYKVSGINASAKGTDQGRYKTTITGTPVVTDAAGNNVTAQFKVEVIEGQLNIAKRDITITAGSAQAVYNGRALTKNTSEITAGTLAVGDSYTATIEGSQLYVGSSGNVIKTVTITADKAGQKRDVTDNYNVTLVPGTLTVTDGTPEIPVDPSLVVNKTHEGKTEGGDFKAGDVITFTIKVKNIYDEVKTITLEEQAGVTLDQAVFENVQPGAEITATATYTVTEADLINGTFTNNVTARFSGVDKEYPGTDTVEELEDPRPHMTITKKTTGAEDGHIYKLGETINYEITVKNDGNLTLTNVTVEDALTGNTGENAWTIPTLAPGAEKTFTASYEVTEADVLAGKVVNNATGTAENPDPNQPETPIVPGEKEDPTETPNPSLFVEKTASDAPEGGFAVGDEITYTITVTNNGNVTVKDIKVTDKLTGNTGDKAFTVDKLAPGKSKTFTAKYTVTEADVIAGKIENVAKAAGKDPEGKDVTGEGKEEVLTEESNPHITVTKETTSTPKNGETYALGEEIAYKITVKNDGNLTLTNVTVEDALTGNTGDQAFKIDGEFKPGDEKTFKTAYTVTEADLGKTVVNVATATGTTPDPDKPEPGVDPGETEDPTDQKNPAMTIEKKVIDQKEEYEIGDTVRYEITVTNTGNTTQNNILVEDQMKAAGQAVIKSVEGANGTIDGANVTLDTLAPGKAATITVEYTVVKADRGNTLTNVAAAKGDGEDPKTPEIPVDVEDVYDIHVVHAFAPDNEGDVTLPADYTIENLKPGTVKSLMAEGVTGYVAYPAVQSATVIDRDITITFLYYKDEIGTDPIDPDKPDGVPDEFQAVVRFTAVNGTVSIDHVVVTLFGEDGKPAKNGVGHLSALQIAAATANAGYDQSSLSWAPGTPTMDYNITGNMTFTATFTATPVTPPATPDNPTPDNLTPPAGQTPEPAGNTFVDNVVTPVVETVREKVAQIQEVFNSDDEGVPLANQNLDNHKCCILHFLIMLITLLVYALATKSMKNRQKKLHEAREELDCELARRGLPLFREKE